MSCRPAPLRSESPRHRVRRLTSTAAILLTAVAPVTCGPLRAGSGRGDVPPLSCARPDIDVSSWQLIDRAPFSFRLPAGFSKEEAHPIDSFAEFFVASGRSISFDYGHYSGGEPRRARGYEECTTTISGREARIASWPESGGYATLAQWRDIARSGENGMAIHLSMYAWSPTPAGQRDAMAVFHSLRLK